MFREAGEEVGIVGWVAKGKVPLCVVTSFPCPSISPRRRPPLQPLCTHVVSLQAACPPSQLPIDFGRTNPGHDRTHRREAERCRESRGSSVDPVLRGAITRAPSLASFLHEANVTDRRFSRRHQSQRGSRDVVPHVIPAISTRLKPSFAHPPTPARELDHHGRDATPLPHRAQRPAESPRGNLTLSHFPTSTATRAIAELPTRFSIPLRLPEYRFPSIPEWLAVRVRGITCIPPSRRPNPCQSQDPSRCISQRPRAKTSSAS